MRYRNVASGRWNLSTWCSVNNLRLAASLNISGFLSPAGSIADKKQEKKQNTTAITVKLWKENSLSDTSANVAGWWVAGFSRCSPCASPSVGTSSSSSSSPRRSLGCWGQQRSRPLSTCPDAASRPTLPSDETGRPNNSGATTVIRIYCSWLHVVHANKPYLFGVFGRAGAVASGVGGSERAGWRFV